MKLRQKLLSTFGGLAVLALLNAGVTGWAIYNWQVTNRELNQHYQRSLLVKELRMLVIEASQEIREAISVGEPQTRNQFEMVLAPVPQYFQTWSQLAHNKAEKKQITELKAAYLTWKNDSEEILQLLAAGQTFEALKSRREKFNHTSLPLFEELGNRAVNSDQQYRQEILAQVRQSQETAELVLILAAFGTISLTLLLIAYLNSDLFIPLQEVKHALDNVIQGDRQIALDIERADEIGSVNRAFNRLVASLQKREQLVNLNALPANQEYPLKNTPSRLLVHQLLNQMGGQLSQLERANGNLHLAKKQAIISQVMALLHTVTHLTEFGFPLDLNLTEIEIPALLYEMLISFQEKFVTRKISIELEIAPEVKRAKVDRLKLREALKQLLDNALAAVPETGGQIGMSAQVVPNGTELIIDVTDNGKGITQSLLNHIFDDVAILSGDRQHPAPMGLKLAKEIVEEHGGELTLHSELHQGTQVQIKLPLLTKKSRSYMYDRHSN